MKIEVPAGKYVVAVSGGVDSMVLLDLLRLYPGAKLIVAHYDHGIREDSAKDKQFVQAAARRYGVGYVFDKGNLGAWASEAEARSARYTFLKKVQSASGANAIATAHHQDDVLETTIINLLRGTGRKGLSSLTDGEGIIRPLLAVPKSEILDYAIRHRIQWREDSTNNDVRYLRNHIRHNMLTAWKPESKSTLLQIGRRMETVNDEIDDVINGQIQNVIQREWFIMLPHVVAKEVMTSWLRKHGVQDFSRQTIDRLTVFSKVAQNGKSTDVVRNWKLAVTKDLLALEHVER